MDGVQRYIANDDDRPADEVEQADAALGALAAQHLTAGTATEVYIYTTDIVAGHGAETVLSSEGYGDSVTGIEFADGILFSRSCDFVDAIAEVDEVVVGNQLLAAEIDSTNWFLSLDSVPRSNDTDTVLSAHSLPAYRSDALLRLASIHRDTPLRPELDRWT